jgi:hypothetical protein
MLAVTRSCERIMQRKTKYAHKEDLQVHRLKTSPTNKLRLKFKAKQDPYLIEKVIVLDASPPQLANKKSTRKST